MTGPKMADVQHVPDASSGNQPNNPLSRKLNKVLETRLDNDKVRERFGKISGQFIVYLLCN